MKIIRDSLPITQSGQRDWDSPDSIDFQLLRDTLSYAISHHGNLPVDLRSIEDCQPLGIFLSLSLSPSLPLMFPFSSFLFFGGRKK